MKVRQSGTGRFTGMFSLMNQMYHLEQDKPLTQRFVRLQGPVKTQSMQQLDEELQKTLQAQIQINSFWAWVMLFITVALAAGIPCWVMSGKMEFSTKNGWRFLVITAFMVPFLMYEQRNAKNDNEKLKHFLTVEKLKPIIVSTINFSIWFAFLIYACKYTSMSHALALSSLRLFLISLIKLKNGEKLHQFQIAGSILSFIGIFLVCTDSLTLPIIIDPTQTRKYLWRQPWQRVVIGDGCALIASVCSVYLDQNQKVPGMPRFTYMFFYNFFNAISLITFGYFFGGTDFNFDTQYGIFGMFTYKNFVEIMNVGIIIGFIMMMLHILVGQIFNELVINISNAFKFIISCIIMQVLHLQLIMSGLTCLGYCFLVPGMVFVIGGQAALTHTNNKLAFQLYKPPDLFCPKLIGQDNVIDNSMVLQKEKSILERSRQYMVSLKPPNLAENNKKE